MNILKTLFTLCILCMVVSQLSGCATTTVNPKDLIIYQPKLPAGISSVDEAIDDLARLLARRKDGMIIDYDYDFINTRPGCNSRCAELVASDYGASNITWWQPQQVAVIVLPGIRVYRDFLDIPVSPVYFSSLKGIEIDVRRGAAIPDARLIGLPNHLSLRLYLPDMADAQRIADDLLYIQQNYEQYRQEKRTRFEAEATRYRSLTAKPSVSEEQRMFIVQANAMNQRKDYMKAVDLYLQAIEVDPVAYPGAYFNLALLSAQMERYKPAISYMKQYLMLEPDSKDARSAQDKIYEWEILSAQKH